MKVMIDTNVFISAILFPESIPSKALSKALAKHSIVLCTQIIEELKYIFQNKFTSRTTDFKDFMSRCSFEVVDTPQKINVKDYPNIRDKADFPILVSAINAKVDLLVTGDKDFFALKIKTPKEFCEYY